MNERLCISYVVEGQTQRLILSITPKDLWNTMFLAYHAAPSCGHMGWILWPGMRKYVEDRIASCPHCILSYSTKKVKSELMFSWPIDSPFTTIRVNLWSAGEIEDDGSQLHIMMGMCDVTQFVLVTYAESTLTCDLNPIFMQEMLLKVGLCVVAINEGSTFKGEFQEMCRILKIRYNVVACANHKGIYVRSKTEV
jgi:hypothetical protein